MTNGEVRNKLMSELKDLSEKIYKLQIFAYTNKFKTLNEEEQRLLLDQEKQMKEYQKILIKRIAILIDKIEQNKIKEEYDCMVFV